MKKLKGLNSQLENVMSNTGGALPPPFKEVMLNCIGSVRGLDPVKTVRLGMLGLSILRGHDTVILEDSDADLLIEVLHKSSRIYPDFWIGQVVAKIRDSESLRP